MVKRIILLLSLIGLVTITMLLLVTVTGMEFYLAKLGINRYVLGTLCFAWGLGGATLSILLSKRLAIWTMDIHLIHPETQESGAKRLLQYVESLAQKAQVKTPKVGFYFSSQVNAFATGATKNKALIAVSTGLLEQMGTEEVEGVLAHEMAHISNGDMITMALLQGVLNAFVVFYARSIAFVVYALIANEEEQTWEQNTSAFLTFTVISAILQAMFMFLGSFLINAFSRWREYHADKGGAALVGKENVLAALHFLYSKEGVDSHEPMYKTQFIHGKRNKWLALSTHPPLQERIHRLESS